MDHRFSIAPMLDWTDKHCRYFHRLLSEHAVLYTEMVTTGAIIYGQGDYLAFNEEEHPVVVQLGGSDPKDMAHSAKLCQLSADACIYPSYYFCTPEAGKENFSIHHFNGSWFEEYSRKLLVYLAGYQLLRLKRNKVRTGELPLKQGEKKIALLELNSRYSLLLLKS